MAYYQYRGFDYDSTLDVLNNPKLFVKDSKMVFIAEQAVKILREFPELHIPAIQHKGDNYLNTCWCVGFEEAQNCKESLFNFTIIPSNLNVEFRRAKVMSSWDFDKMKWQQKGSLPRIPLIENKQNNHNKLVEYIKTYLEEIKNVEYKIKGTSLAEKMIFDCVKKIFPDLQIIANHRPDDMRSDKGVPLEFDIFLPRKLLAFEIQGPQHFGEAIYGLESTQRLMENDNVKVKYCKDNNIKLIMINWFGFKKEMSAWNFQERCNYLKWLIKAHMDSDQFIMIWKDSQNIFSFNDGMDQIIDNYI